MDHRPPTSTPAAEPVAAKGNQVCSPCSSVLHMRLQSFVLAPTLSSLGISLAAHPDALHALGMKEPPYTWEIWFESA